MQGAAGVLGTESDCLSPLRGLRGVSTGPAAIGVAGPMRMANMIAAKTAGSGKTRREALARDSLTQSAFRERLSPAAPRQQSGRGRAAALRRPSDPAGPERG